MVELSAQGLTPNTAYTASSTFHGMQIPLVTFRTDAQGAAPQVLAFTKFFGIYGVSTLTVQPAT
ncbi:hypothetical protein V3C33_16895 [Micrococcaceae bacterium Sec5.7]